MGASLRRIGVVAFALMLAVLAVRTAETAIASRPLPPIVFVSRVPPTGEAAGQVPGLGPHGTFAGNGGRLLEREPDGRVRELAPAARFFDVADPAPAPDRRRVAFAAREAAGAPWRIWTVDRTSGALACRTCDGDLPAAGAGRIGDDADPAWWGGMLVFVSTRAGGTSLYDGTPLTQLWALLPDGRTRQLTFERNGVLDPTFDTRGRLLFSRWWFNPWTPDSARGVARSPMRTADSVNVWQVVLGKLVWDAHGLPRLEDVRLAAGGRTPRRRSMGVQPVALANGRLVAVAARNTGLAPRPGELALQRFGAPPSAGTRIAGAAIGDDSDDPYREGANLLAPRACAPAALADGRIVHALDPGGRGEWGLWLMSPDGATREPLLDLPGTWELDPAPVPERAAAVPPMPRFEAARDTADVPTFRYLATDVFAGRGAAPRQDGARLHVYRLIGADSLESLRRVQVPRNGRVDLRLPADAPLFEILTDSVGRVLVSAHGATQVRGFNSGAPGSTARCRGCHLGHSAGR